MPTDPTSRRLDLVVMGVALSGVVVRLRQYFADRSFWHDEVLVSVDLDELTLLSSLTNPSPRNQLAPAGFWVVSHAADAVSSSEEVLRLPTLVGGLVLVGLALWYARTVLHHPAARVFLVATVAWSPPLIHYSSELKQYGLEATVSMALLVMAVARDRLGRTGLVLGGVGALAFSLPALVLVPIFGLAWLVAEAAKRGVAAAVRHLLVPGSLLVAAQLGAFAFARRTEPEAVRGFWSSAFAPLPVRPAAIEWWVDSILGIVHLTVRNVGIAGHLPIDDWHDPSTWVVTVAFVALVVAGGVAAARLRSSGLHASGAGPTSSAVAAWWAFVPLLIAVGVVFAALAVVELYPLRGRLIVFLVPLLLVVAAHGVDVLLARSGAHALPRILTLAAAAIVVAAALVTSVGIVADPYRRFDMDSALAWVAAGAEPGDVIVLEFGSETQWIHYAPHHELDGIDLEKRSLDDVVAGDALTADRPPGTTVWFVHAFVTRSQDERVDDLADRDDVIDRFRADGTVALAIRPG